MSTDKRKGAPSGERPCMFCLPRESLDHFLWESQTSSVHVLGALLVLLGSESPIHIMWSHGLCEHRAERLDTLNFSLMLKLAQKTEYRMWGCRSLGSIPDTAWSPEHQQVWLPNNTDQALSLRLALPTPYRRKVRTG